MISGAARRRDGDRVNETADLAAFRDLLPFAVLIGIELLHASLCDFPAEQAANEAEFFTRVAFFEFLETQEREAILKTRLAYLEGCLDYLHTMQRLADEGDCAPGTGISMSNAQRVLAFHLQRVHHEYQWTATWLEEMQANQP